MGQAMGYMLKHWENRVLPVSAHESAIGGLIFFLGRPFAAAGRNYGRYKIKSWLCRSSQGTEAV
jgi:hypothetical protein